LAGASAFSNTVGIGVVFHPKVQAILRTVTKLTIRPALYLSSPGSRSLLQSLTAAFPVAPKQALPAKLTGA
jgi:hypothetical protein